MKAPRNSLVPQACLVCGTMFKPQRTGMRFCSRKCSAQWKIANGLHPRRPKDPTKYGVLTCPVCGHDFTYLLTQPPRRCCSRSCAATLRMRENRNPLQDRKPDPSKYTKTTCPTCGKVFEYLLTWPRIYCCGTCRSKAKITNIKKWAPTGYDAECEVCGKVFHGNKSRRGRFCSLKCFGKWQSENIRGELSPAWRGGYEPYYGPTWESARRAVLARDKVCQGCGITPEQLGKQLDVHHIKPFRTFGRERHQEANDLINLIALCPACHKKWEIAGYQAASISIGISS